MSVGPLNFVTTPWMSDEVLDDVGHVEECLMPSETNGLLQPLSTLANIWSLLKEAALGFINDEALSRGAAMAFFAVTALAPILLIVVAIAGLVFGREAASPDSCSKQHGYARWG